ncbi:hypothetical protein EC991_009221 [Linnemannia zychae]|nr:hypothetical protein EC991_009221 [Linnemannia zychae]
MCVRTQIQGSYERQQGTIQLYRRYLLKRIAHQFPSHLQAEKFVNTFLVHGWSFGDQTFTDEDYLRVLQDAETANKICIFHNVTLQSGHENVRFILSVDRTQFWWDDSKRDRGLWIGKWTAFDYAHPYQLSVKLLLPLLDKIITLEKKRPIHPDIRLIFNKMKNAAKTKKKKFEWDEHEFQFILEFFEGRSCITGAHLGGIVGAIEVGHLD